MDSERRSSSSAPAAARLAPAVGRDENKSSSATQVTEKSDHLGASGFDKEHQKEEGSNDGADCNRSGYYRYGCLAVWLIVTLMMVLDRFYWNMWPRQTICAPNCGNDFFCDMDEDPGCLKRGPWTAKVFDAIARASARIIISTTSLMFVTMCHGTFNYLSEVRCLRPYLYAWRHDNFWLHSIGGWTMGVWVIAHVWALFLPSMFHGFKNVAVGGSWNYPAQISLAASNIDVDNKLANWGYDDIWRIVWMTIIFAVLMPLSRSAWALKKNFSLAMWLHLFLGVGVFIDSFRRTTHPHVWILNTPFFLWWLADKILCSTSHRVDPCAEATRIMLDDEYMLLLWKGTDIPKRICDVFWIKRGYDATDPFRSGRHGRRNGEMSHPFTTCSSHDVTVTKACSAPGDKRSFTTITDVRPSIELPCKTDVSWPGHRFTLTSILSQISTVASHNFDSVRSNRSARGVSKTRSGHWGVNSPAAPPSLGRLQSSSPTSVSQSSRSASRSRANRRTWGWQPVEHFASTTFPEDDELLDEGGNPSVSEHVKKAVEDVEGDGTMIGVDVAAGENADDHVTLVVGKIKPKAPTPGGRSMIAESVDKFFEDEKDDSTDQGSIFNYPKTNRTSPSTPPDDVKIIKRQAIPKLTDVALDNNTNAENNRTKLRASGKASRAEPKRPVLMRIPTQTFEEYRKRDGGEGRGGPLPGSWSKMAIVRVHRRSPPKVRECSCLGITHVLSSFRKPETQSIADLEVGTTDENGGTIPLRTYGPYRSEYGRLCEFPNLPPILVIATGAGAALVLDFVAYVRANNLVPVHGVTVCFSSASLPLLQFVTNTLLAERTVGIEVKTALTRHDDLQLFDTSISEKQQQLAMGRLDVKSIVSAASTDTEVYFCGGGGINAMLKKLCASRGMKYVGSSVQ